MHLYLHLLLLLLLPSACKKTRRGGAAADFAGDFSAALVYAEEQREKSAANLDCIIKLKTKLEVEYVKALCTAFDDERKRDEVKARAIGSTPLSAAPYLKPYF